MRLKKDFKVTLLSGVLSVTLMTPAVAVPNRVTTNITKDVVTTEQVLEPTPITTPGQAVIPELLPEEGLVEEIVSSDSTFEQMPYVEQVTGNQEVITITATDDMVAEQGAFVAFAPGDAGLAVDDTVLTNPFNNKTVTTSDNITYAFANEGDFSGNDVIKISGIGRKTMDLKTIGAYDKIYVLATAGGVSPYDGSRFSVTLTYTDGSTSTESYELYDWCYSMNSPGNQAPPGVGATEGFYRYSYEDKKDTGVGSNVRLYSKDIQVNPTKLLQSITFDNSSSNLTCGIFAVTGVTADGVPSTPVINTTALDTGVITFATAGATGYYVDIYQEEHGEIVFVDGWNNRSVAEDTLNLNTINLPVDSYKVRVRAKNDNGQSLSSAPVTFELKSSIGVEMTSDSPYIIEGKTSSVTYEITSQGIEGDLSFDIDWMESVTGESPQGITTTLTSPETDDEDPERKTATLTVTTDGTTATGIYPFKVTNTLEDTTSQTLEYVIAVDFEKPNATVTYDLKKQVITHTTPHMEYSTDGGTTWELCTDDETSIELEKGDTLTMRDKNYPAHQKTIIAEPLTQHSAPAEEALLIETTQTTVTVGSVEPNVDAAWEYSQDGQNWSKDNCFEGLTPATKQTIYVRVEATDTVLASIAREVVCVTLPETTAVTVDYSNEVVTFDEETYELATTPEGSQLLESGDSVEDYFGKNIYLRVKKANDAPASGWVEVPLIARPEAPGIDAFVKQQETVKNKQDATLSGLTEDMMYQIGESEWQVVTPSMNGKVNNPKNETISVRQKGTNNTPASQEIVIDFTPSTTTLTVYFDTAGGTLISEQSNLAYADKIMQPLEEVTKEGWFFAGWYKDAEYTMAWNFGDEVEDNMTLFARWEKEATIPSIQGVVTESSLAVPGARVELLKGNEVVASVVTDENGHYTFTNIPEGVYNIVIESENKRKTIIVELEGATVEAPTVAIPDKEVSSSVEVKDDTLGIIVGGLDSVAEAFVPNQGEHIEVKLDIESQTEATASPEVVEAMEALAHNQELEFLDLKVNKTVTAQSGTTTTEMDTVDSVLEVRVPFDAEKVDGLAIYREYDKGSAAVQVEALRALNAKPTGSFEDGTFFVEDGFITIYTRHMSTHAVGYAAEEVEEEDDTVAYTYYDITIKVGANGQVTPSGDDKGKVSVKENRDRTFKFVADDGYSVEDVLVDGQSVGRVMEYTFEDVRRDHTLEVVFRAEVNDEVDTIPHNPFTDVNQTDWFFDAVVEAYEKGLMVGVSDTAFEPNAGTERAMITTILHRIENTPKVTEEALFTDIRSDAWYTEAIAWGAHHQVIKGYGNDLFKPNQVITRQELCSIIYQYAKYKNYETTLQADLSQFADEAEIGNWAREAVAYVVEQGIMCGKEDRLFDPTGKATRAEVAAVMLKLLELEQ